MTEKDENKDRRRYYGVRVGDRVVYGIPGFPDTDSEYEVIRYGFLDNNRVILRDSDGNEMKAVAEYCRIISKVEDKEI